LERDGRINRTSHAKRARKPSKSYVLEVCKALAEEYPNAICALAHADPYQLLVATILSAQCTDVRVNLVTPQLFRRFPSAARLAEADSAELEELIRSTGFFRAKSKNLMAMAKQVVKEHGGEIPRDLDSLTRLAGVGRKTANVVLGTAYGIATGIVVDTHVKRLSRRLGLTTGRSPEEIERELMKVVPRTQWVDFSHQMIQHGRKVCMARKPHCETCPFRTFCPRCDVADPGLVAGRRAEKGLGLGRGHGDGSQTV
jgi:endonuclease-3